MSNLLTLDQLLAKINSNFNKVLLITNKNSFKKNGFDKIISEKFSIPFTHITSFSINPNLEEIIEILKDIDLLEYDYILGVGGGSALDVAKALYLYTKFKNLNEAEIIKSLSSDIEFKESKSQLALIPTTNGSGSEATHFSVIYYQNVKYSLANKLMYPHDVVLDSQFTKNLPDKIMRYTALDAFVHAIEAYWSKNATNSSKEFSLKALSLLNKSINNISENTSKNDRQNLLLASYYAGKAIDIAKTTAAHASSYYFTKKFDIPHGQSVANCLYYFLETNANKVDIKPLLNELNMQSIDELKSFLHQYLDNSQMFLNFNELNIDWDDFINTINFQRMKNNPAKLSQEQILKLFRNN